MCPWCRETRFLKLYTSFPQTSEESNSQSDEGDDVRPIQLTSDVFPLLTCGTASFCVSRQLTLFTVFPQSNFMAETRDNSMASEENVRKVGEKIFTIT